MLTCAAFLFTHSCCHCSAVMLSVAGPESARCRLQWPQLGARCSLLPQSCLFVTPALCFVQAVVKVLLDMGADHTLKDSLGHTAMCEAVRNNHARVMDAMLARGARYGRHMCFYTGSESALL